MTATETCTPRDAQISESVSDRMCRDTEAIGQRDNMELQEDECIAMTKQAFSRIITNCRNKWKNAWSKEYCEMDEDRLVETILKYMTDWMMADRSEEESDHRYCLR